MGIRTVRLGEETEKALEEIVNVTGLSVSAAMKKGLVVFRDDAVRAARRAPYDIDKELDLGPGGSRGRPPQAPAVMLLDTGAVVAPFDPGRMPSPTSLPAWVPGCGSSTPRPCSGYSN